MNALTNVAHVDLLKSCLSCLPLCSYVDVAPGEMTTVAIWSSFSEFPEKAGFGQETSDCFEVDEVSLRSWTKVSRVLQSRDRGDRTDLASIGELLCRVVLPCCVDLTFTVRNVGSVPQKFWCAIASRTSIVDRRENLLRNWSSDRRPLDYARWWWKEDHQHLVDLSEEEARRIEATLARCADGSPRRDLRVSLD